MKCPHGKLVRVVLEPESSGMWDAGFKTADKDGSEHKSSGEGKFLPLVGCDHPDCQVIHWMVKDHGKLIAGGSRW